MQLSRSVFVYTNIFSKGPELLVFDMNILQQSTPYNIV
jgi:hypothetical protein